jgi:hypothetical protein
VARWVGVLLLLIPCIGSERPGEFIVPDQDEKAEHWAFRSATPPATRVCITVLVTVLQALPEVARTDPSSPGSLFMYDRS